MKQIESKIMFFVILLIIPIFSLKEKIRNGSITFGSILTIPDPQIIENMVSQSNDLDFLWLEAEHLTFQTRLVENLVRVCENENIVPIIRVPQNGVDNIKKWISSGTGGIIVPYLKTFDDAKEIVNSCYYPPIGERRVGIERANKYLSNFDVKKSNENIIVGAMIETKESLEHLEEILEEIEEIDFFFVGKYDLSSSLGVSLSSKELEESVEYIEKLCMKYKKPLAVMINDPEDINDLKERGYSVFLIPGDYYYLQTGVKNWFENYKKLCS